MKRLQHVLPGETLYHWWHVGHVFLNNSCSIQGLIYSELVSLRGRAGWFSSTLTPCIRHCWSVDWRMGQLFSFACRMEQWRAESALLGALSLPYRGDRSVPVSWEMSKYWGCLGTTLDLQRTWDWWESRNAAHSGRCCLLQRQQALCGFSYYAAAEILDSFKQDQRLRSVPRMYLQEEARAFVKGRNEERNVRRRIKREARIWVSEWKIK